MSVRGGGYFFFFILMWWQRGAWRCETKRNCVGISMWRKQNGWNQRNFLRFFFFLFHFGYYMRSFIWKKMERKRAINIVYFLFYRYAHKLTQLYNQVIYHFEICLIFNDFSFLFVCVCAFFVSVSSESKMIWSFLHKLHNFILMWNAIQQSLKSVWYLSSMFDFICVIVFVCWFKVKLFVHECEGFSYHLFLFL